MNGPTSLFGSDSYMGLPSPSRNDYSSVFGSAPGNVPVSVPASLVARNPLEGTHELRQACQVCFIRKGKAQKRNMLQFNVGGCTIFYPKKVNFPDFSLSFDDVRLIKNSTN